MQITVSQLPLKEEPVTVARRDRRAESKMFLNALFTLLLMLLSICEGFDFNFEETGMCGVMTCTEVVAKRPADTRKIKTLTVYKKDSSSEVGSKKWEQLAKVTSKSHTVQEISDSHNIVGHFSDTDARIRVRLLKSGGCKSQKLACEARLVDNTGRISAMKAVVGTKKFPKEIAESAENEGDQASEIINAIESIMAALVEKIENIETRLGDSNERDDRIEDKLETLDGKVDCLDRNVSRGITPPGDRLEEKLDSMTVRLAEKLTEVIARIPPPVNESKCLNEVCTSMSSKLSVVGNSVESLNENLDSLGDEVRGVKSSMPTATELNNKLDKMTSTAEAISTTSNDLLASVDALNNTCVHNSPASTEYFDVLGTGKKEWRLVFRGTAHNNVQVYPAYLHGTGIPVPAKEGCKQFNPSLPCTNHYRNTAAFYSWANVDKVLLVLYVNGRKVKHIMFNGVGSTNINWFAGERVIESSWRDLKTLRHNIFSVEGDGRPRLLRRFYANHQYGGCNNDKGWFVAADAVPGGCLWEKKEKAPTFLYSKGDHLAWWKHSDQVAEADAMGIFIKYQ
ncbi:hypothetical protein ElyMa_006798200 [Elysia marginata]|uniref:Fibrinogen C-terminal domain-containing protein n=1 Tax=Elysia marginata TaxID=1093978 RepID=A0AAV4J3H4_9GAST|nr:hypothetical protein ElyMa_006798200 [Elysia marginata]